MAERERIVERQRVNPDHDDQHDHSKQRKRRVVHQERSTRGEIVNRVSQFVLLIFAVIIGLIAFRFVLLLLDANPANQFASFIYDTSAFFVDPFLTLFNSPSAESGAILELPSIVAMVAYLALAFIIVMVIRIFFDQDGSSRTVRYFRRRERD